MTDQSERRRLRTAIETHLVPALQSHGFRQLPVNKIESSEREYKSAMPFGRFAREKPDKIDLLEIQLNSHARPEFRINFGSLSDMRLVAHSNVHGLPEYFVLRPRLGRWFKVRVWPWQSRRDVTFDGLVISVIPLLAEIDDALNSGLIGRHVVAVSFEPRTKQT